MKFVSIVLLALLSFGCFAQNITDKNFTYRNGFLEANYNGRNGQSGRNGASRFTITLFHMAKRGGNGKPGKPGPALQVNVSAIPSGDSAILVIVINKAGDKKTDKYYVNPRHGKISISANGGNGGSGGEGENGEEVTEKRPYGNSGGEGGNGADGGNGGTIHVTFDSTALDYVKCDCIIYHNDGGTGGMRGEGGKATGSASADGGPGIDGGSGVSDPRIFIKDKDGKVLWIARSFDRFSR